MHAGAGVHLDIGVVGIGFARQQRLELAPRGLRLEAPERVLGFRHDLGVFLGLAELDHGELVVEVALDARDRVELVVERVALLHHALCAGGVVPEIGIFRLLVQLGEAGLRLVEVKDASSAARPTA